MAAAADPYMVKGVMVDVSGTSALDARNKAFAEVRRKAFLQMAAQALPEKDRANLTAPDDRTIASAVRDFEIVSEKMTSRRYAGTVDVRFTPAAAKRALQMAIAGIPAEETLSPDPNAIVGGDVATTITTTTTTTPSEMRPNSIAARNAMNDDYVYSPRRAGAKSAAMSARSILVLPWYGITGRQTLWGQGNPWRAAWEENKALSQDQSLPIVLPVGDAADLRDYSPPQGLSRRGDLESLMKRYGATDAVMAMAEPANDGSVIVSLYQYQNGGPVPMGRFGVDGTSHDVLGEAVQKSVNALHGMASASVQQNAAPVPVSMGPGAVSNPHYAPVPVMGSYRTLAQFSGLQEWVAMRQALLRVPGMGGVNIHSISPSQANIEFTYSGDVNTLAAAMAQNGLQLSQLQPGAPVAAGDVTPQYALTMGRVY